MYDGIINVYKEKGFTSHDVVAKMRGILREKDRSPGLYVLQRIDRYSHS